MSRWELTISFVVCFVLISIGLWLVDWLFNGDDKDRR